MRCLLLVLDQSWKGEYPNLIQALKESKYDVDVGILSPDINVNYKYEFVYEDLDIEKIVEDYDCLGIAGGYRLYYITCGKKFPCRKLESPKICTGILDRAVKRASETDRLIIAPIAAPAYIAKFGILKGRKATVYPTTDLIKILIENGAEFVNDVVVRDGNIITLKRVNVEELKKKLTMQ